MAARSKQETTPTMIEVTPRPAPEAIKQRLTRLFEKPDGPRDTPPPGFPPWETTMEKSGWTPNCLISELPLGKC